MGEHLENVCMLTAQQKKTLDFIREHLHECGHAPTMGEICDALGLSSRGSVHKLVQALIDKHYLVRASSGWRSLQLVGEGDTSTLPLVGRIAAGQPIEAIPGEDTLNLSDFLLGPNRYALRVVGDSMTGIGIMDGDTVIVEQADTARTGEVVVALIDGQEATLKRLKRRKDGTVELIAENPSIAPMIFPASRVLIQGVVVGQLRSYR